MGVIDEAHRRWQLLKYSCRHRLGLVIGKSDFLVAAWLPSEGLITRQLALYVIIELYVCSSIVSNACYQDLMGWDKVCSVVEPMRFCIKEKGMN